MRTKFLKTKYFKRLFCLSIVEMHHTKDLIFYIYQRFGLINQLVDINVYISNGHSTANLSNLSTRQKFAIFVEFEYSPKWSFWKIGWTRYIRPHSPTCFAFTRQARWRSLNHFARTRQTCERQVWRVLHEFSKFGEFGEFSKCRLDCFIHIKYVICA